MEAAKRPTGTNLWVSKLQQGAWRAECEAAAAEGSTARLAFSAGVLLRHTAMWKKRNGTGKRGK